MGNLIHLCWFILEAITEKGACLGLYKLTLNLPSGKILTGGGIYGSYCQRLRNEPGLYLARNKIRSLQVITPKSFLGVISDISEFVTYFCLSPDYFWIVTHDKNLCLSAFPSALTMGVQPDLF
ncbi:hypothetical protein BJP34_33885 [Moorena producens PAL-8-15-08-1]|uniref:Uncharacterized protein n=1 Tax=Moorena producens PAL-8-15-08-1 TaxID=1458985 RepID=A0A1D8U1H3_9CYAN|nr:hypothetical protein [Moorena producens]AOX03761.1 hypothetical protein BJP34_33885 [Moorena producens PAL-8-15-08-1]